MREKSYVLRPFPSDRAAPLFALRSRIGRRGDKLSVSYFLSDPMREIVVPGKTKRPSRRGGLWEETCFEFFLAQRDSKRYWEFNLSPSSDWNVYRFSSYREGMKEETAFDSLPFMVRRYPQGLGLSVKVDLKKIDLSSGILQIGLSAVIKDDKDGITYWALTHPGTKPDFHLREGFIAGT